MTFIAAMDNSGGSAGGVLDTYGQEWSEEDKMEKIHAFRMRMINSANFNSKYIDAAILYKDSVERGAVSVLKEKGINAILKIDSGANDDGTLKEFDDQSMIGNIQGSGRVYSNFRCDFEAGGSQIRSPELRNPQIGETPAQCTVSSCFGILDRSCCI